MRKSQRSTRALWVGVVCIVDFDYQTSMRSVDLISPSSDFFRAWHHTFGDTPPIGHRLRQIFLEHWTRFHALPQARRYAETEDEWSVLLARANTLGINCFEEHARIWVVAGYQSDFQPKGHDLAVRMGMTKAMTWIDHSEDLGGQVKLGFYAVAFDWSPGSLDELFGEIARDEQRALLFSEDKKTVLAPYDGGFDVVSLLPGKINSLESKFRDWMSNRSDRL